MTVNSSVDLSKKHQADWLNVVLGVAKGWTP